MNPADFDSAALKADVGVFQDIVKVSFGKCRADVQENAVCKMLGLATEMLSTGSLLQSAIKKLESFGKNADNRLAKDKGHTLLGVIARTSKRYNEIEEEMYTLRESGWPNFAVSIEESDLQERHDLMTSSIFGSFAQFLHHESFEDCIRRHVSQECVKVDQLKDKIIAGCRRKQRGGQDCWSTGLEDSADFKAVAEQARTQWQGLDAEGLDTQWNAFVEAGLSLSGTLPCFGFLSPSS